MDDLSLLPIEAVLQLTGFLRSKIYLDIRNGLLTAPVTIGPKCSRWPAGEVRQVVKARIAGKSDAEIRSMVEGLHEARKVAA